MKKKNTEKKNRTSAFAVFFQSAWDYIKKKYPFLLVFAAGFIAITLVNFYKVSTTESVASFVLDDFEIGQISDRTIIAEKSLPADEINPISVQKGEKILKKGFPVTEDAYDKLKKIVSSPIYIDYRAFANSEIYLFVVAVMWYLLMSLLPFDRKIKLSELILQVVFVVIVYLCAGLGGKLRPFSTPYAICVIVPSSLCVFLSAILYGQISSMVLSFIISLVLLNATNWGLPAFLFTLGSTLCSTAIVKNISKRIDMIFASVMMSVVNMVLVLTIGVVFNENLFDLRFVFFGVALNGFLSGLLALGLLTPLEILLNTASVFRLMDLSDLNNAFMQNMLVQASGTYQHSMMVAQLAEKACREIKANFLVARVGAYYHDIGKIEQSEYFVENQKGENIHNSINPSLSVSVIRSHVKRGIEKARQLHLPQVVIDIIAEHHGNSVIAYFYNEAKAKDPSVSPKDFSYTGNPPSSRESGVVMLADTVEAACRTLENKSVSSLERFIAKLVQGKIDHNQLDNCNLTFRDLTKVKQAFVQILAGYYHSRIEYPDEKKAEAEKPVEKAEKVEKIEKVEKAEKAEDKKEEKKTEAEKLLKKEKEKEKAETEKALKKTKKEIEMEKDSGKSEDDAVKPAESVEAMKAEAKKRDDSAFAEKQDAQAENIIVENEKKTEI